MENSENESHYPETYQDPAVGGVDSDPTSSGLSNFEAYAFGVEVGQGPVSTIPNIYPLNNDAGVTFQWRHESDVRYSVLVTEDLADGDSWTSVATYDPELGSWTGTADIDFSGSNPKTATLGNLTQLIEEGNVVFLKLEVLSVVSP